MSTRFRNIKGTFDVLPDNSTSDGAPVAPAVAWRYAESVIHEQMRRYGVREIRTPILEPTDLIARGVGQLTDIVSKELFAFAKGKTNYVLRPEVTAPVMRSYLQHSLGQQGGSQRLYYIGPCFRAERPQKGRYRQFHQFGCEYIGAADPRTDAEVILLMLSIYKALGVSRTRLRLNTLGDAKSRPRYGDALREYFLPLSDQLSETSRDRLGTNPLRILDTKDPAERDLLANAPRITDFIDVESADHYAAVRSYLDDNSVDYIEDPFLVRGLDYYTRTAFELESPDLGGQSGLAGGGRYDLLAEEIGSSNRVPAVGFAAGLERLFLAMTEEAVDPVEDPAPDVFLVGVGEAAAAALLRIAEDLRRDGYSAAFEFGSRSMKAQMRSADRSGAAVAVVLGDEELAAQCGTVRTMDSGEQQLTPLDGLSTYLGKQLGRE